MTLEECKHKNDLLIEMAETKKQKECSDKPDKARQGCEWLYNDIIKQYKKNKANCR